MTTVLKEGQVYLDRNLKLVEALESGLYHQIRTELHIPAGAGLHAPEGFCVLGVACELHRIETNGPDWQEVYIEDHGSVFSYRGSSGTAPHIVAEWFGWQNTDGDTVRNPILIDEHGNLYGAVELNDGLFYSFKAIAAAFRRTFLASPAERPIPQVSRPIFQLSWKPEYLVFSEDPSKELVEV